MGEVMDKIKILSDQYNDGQHSDVDYVGEVIYELEKLWSELKKGESNHPDVEWLANRLAMATQV